MSYLQPPPGPAPVVVVKDYGGYVNEYAAQTEVYRRSGREVRIHECHSACTMALSLPNVCVFKDSIFKFHQAYDPRNHIINWAVSDQLFHTYPEAVRDRLGGLNRAFTILRGRELIDLGIRDCNESNPRIIMARASVNPPGSAGLGGTASTWSTLTGRLGGLVPNFGSRPQTSPGTTEQGGGKRAPAVPAEMLNPKVPLPPERAVTTETASLEAAPDEGGKVEPGGVPLPVPRPKVLVAYEASLPPIPFMQRIEGSQPILPARFVPFPKRAG